MSPLWDLCDWPEWVLCLSRSEAMRESRSHISLSHRQPSTPLGPFKLLPLGPSQKGPNSGKRHYSQPPNPGSDPSGPSARRIDEVGGRIRWGYCGVTPATKTSTVPHPRAPRFRAGDPGLRRLEDGLTRWTERPEDVRNGGWVSFCPQSPEISPTEEAWRKGESFFVISGCLVNLLGCCNLLRSLLFPPIIPLPPPLSLPLSVSLSLSRSISLHALSSSSTPLSVLSRPLNSALVLF